VSPGKEGQSHSLQADRYVKLQLGIKGRKWKRACPLKTHMSPKPTLVLAMLLGVQVPAFPQLFGIPVVTGVVSSASYSSPVQPGSLISIFGSQLALVKASAPEAVLPLPTQLGGVEVHVNGVPAPLLFVSPDQINAQMPSSIRADPSYITSASVVVSTPNGDSAPASAAMLWFSPAAFSADSSGCGQAAALNTATDGTVSINSPANSAAPGDYISLFGTGMGIPSVLPADGAAATAADPFTEAFGVSIDNVPANNLQYSGLAPTLVGVDQINFQIPRDTRQGCAVPLESVGGLEIPAVTISVNTNRGPCVDPPVASYGQVSLEKTISSGTSNDGEMDEFKAIFPSAPGLVQPALPALGVNIVNLTTPAPNARQCAIPGYTDLSAGVMGIQAPGQDMIAAQPVASANGVKYRQPLPEGFIQPGPYAISTGSGAVTTFQDTVSVGTGINVQTSLAAGTQLSASNHASIAWTGGDPNSILKVTLISDATAAVGRMAVWYVSASAGSLTLSYCQGHNAIEGSYCTFYLPLSSPNQPGKAELIIEVLPPNGAADTVSAPGISEKIRFSWKYRYVFGGLILAP
jgi:uncharacterized protein (TIGR03437 family)